LDRSGPDIGCDAYGRVSPDWTERYQRLGEAILRYLCRCCIRRHYVPKVAVKRGDTGHQRVSGVKGTQ
jgi:hypothetical protein